MSFQKAVAQLLSHEGGFVNHKDDRGKATNWGITQKTYEQWKKRPVSLTEIKEMPRWEAEAIYKALYWDQIKGDSIRNYAMAYLIFDQAVNSGVSTAVARAQSILGISVDGKMGPNTLSALNSVSEKSFIDSFLIASEANYRSIVASDPKQKAFLNGWLNRITSLENYSLKNLGVENAGAISIGVVLIVAVIAIVLTAPRAKGFA